MKKSITRNSKEQEIKRTVKDEKSVAPASAAEALDKTRLILAMNGYPVVDLRPQQREFVGAGYSRPDRYVSPIEFSINGVVFGLYGSRLTIDGTPEKSHVNVYNVKDTYKLIAKIAKDRSPINQQARKPVKPAATSTTTARYLAVCIGAI